MNAALSSGQWRHFYFQSNFLCVRYLGCFDESSARCVLFCQLPFLLFCVWAQACDKAAYPQANAAYIHCVCSVTVLRPPRAAEKQHSWIAIWYSPPTISNHQQLSVLLLSSLFIFFFLVFCHFSCLLFAPTVLLALSLSACYPVVSMSFLSCSVFKKLISSAIVSRHSAGIDWRLSREAQTHMHDRTHPGPLQ